MRLLAVAESLTELGYDITFGFPGTLPTPLVQAGFKVKELPESMLRAAEAEALTWKSGNPGTLQPWGEASTLEGIRSVLREATPDVVVTDLMPLVNVAASLEDIPSVTVLNLALLRFPVGIWMGPFEDLMKRLEIPRWAATRLFGDLFVVADTSQDLGLRDLSPDDASRLFASVREVQFVGPVLRGKLPEKIPIRHPRERPKVVVSLGGAPSVEPLLEAVLLGCAGITAEFLVVTGAARSARVEEAAHALGQTEGAVVTLVDFIPDFLNQLLDADALISHGGLGTLTQALALALPTVLVPNMFEQSINAKRLRGIGEVTNAGDVGPRLARLLNDRQGDAARRRVAENLRLHDGARAAAAAIDRLRRVSADKTMLIQ